MNPLRSVVKVVDKKGLKVEFFFFFFVKCFFPLERPNEHYKRSNRLETHHTTRHKINFIRPNSACVFITGKT